ncbi:MAG: hypothetical protein QOH87_1952, partial [Trebonia sp.]|nr:hypothetical protein [Trebonia sp.]
MQCSLDGFPFRYRGRRSLCGWPAGWLGRPCHPDTLADYVRRGLRGIYLEGGHSGNAGWWSTAAAVDRFLAALTARAMGCDVPPAAPTDLERQAAKATAEFKA